MLDSVDYPSKNKTASEFHILDAVFINIVYNNCAYFPHFHQSSLTSPVLLPKVM